MSGSVREVAIRFALAASSITVTCIFLELAFPALLPFLPLKTHWYLDEGIRVLSQYSKRGAVPENYIALVGDSYAAGKGDWYRAEYKNGRPAFHSAHLIHDRTARDVITFGANGAGSLRALVAEPIAQYEYINASPRFRIEPPQYIIVYFYEGNDLNNNLEDIRRRYEGKWDNSRLFNQDYFDSFIENAVHRADPIYVDAQDQTLTKNLFAVRFVYRLVKDYFREQESAPGRHRPPSQFNCAFVGNEKVRIPDELQSPALELTEDEMDLAIYVFERSLSYLQKQFESSTIGVVYVPSPLSSYPLACDKVKIQTYEDRQSVYESERVRKRSNRISGFIEEATIRNGMRFIDAREFIWQRSSQALVHGPVDWKHFNKDGYSALAEAVIALFDRMGKRG